jgi:predicted nucleotidyltransferase component of viral defense system
MIGVNPATEASLKALSEFNFCQEYVLIGGTAISLQIGHRISVDLDFCKWKKSRNDKPTIDLFQIENELIKLGQFKKDHFDFNFVNYYLSNQVKLSFYANQLYASPVKRTIPVVGLVKVPDILTIGAMKLELMLRRSTFRDYYDIFSILNEGVSLKEMVYLASKYTNHNLKSKNILSFILRPENYAYEDSFAQLEPKYKVNSKDIADYIAILYQKEFSS